MATIAAIHSKLTLNTRDFRTNAQKAQRIAKNMGRSIGRATKLVGGIGIAAGAAAVAGLSVMVKSQMEAIDQTAKLSRSLGISTEALVGYQHAAELSGVKQATLEKGLQRLVRSLGEAKNGTGPGAKGFAELGLSMEDVADKSPEEALGLVADKLAAQEDPAKRAAAAYAVFGRQGQELDNFLRLGSEGMREAQMEAERLGLTFSQIDAFKIEQANDAITRLKGRIVGAGRSLTVELAPFIESAANKLLGMGDDGETMGQKITGAIEWVAGAFGKTMDFVELGKMTFFGLQGVVTKGLALMTRGIGLLGRGIESVVNLIPGVEVEFSDSITRLADNLDDAAANAFKKAQDAANNFADGANSKAVARTFREIREEAQRAAEAAEQASLARFNAEGAAEIEAKLDELRKKAQVEPVLLPPDLARFQTRIDDLAGSEHVVRIRELVELGAGREQLQEALDLAEQLDDMKITVEVDAKLGDFERRLEQIGKDPIDIELADLRRIGATNDQLDRARTTLEQIERIEAQRDREDSIAKALEDLERQVRTHGMSRQELALMDLEALGATEAQLERARRAYAELAALNQGQEPRDAFADEGSDLRRVRAGSAEAQRLAFQAGQAGLGSEDTTPRDQLRVQERMLATLETIESNQTSNTDNGWEIS